MPSIDHSPVPWRTAVKIATGAATPLPPSVVPSSEATGRVLAAPVLARGDLPGFDASAMDGYAVAGRGPWRVLGQVYAGGPVWPAPLGAGEAVEIMTGAVVPAGTVAVLPYETADLNAAGPGPKAHIRRAGEDARAGDELLPAGRLVTPAVAGLLAQAGADSVTVHGRPTVRLVVTGDELVTAGVPGPGQVRDVFTPMVSALVAAAGGVVTDAVLIGDEPELLAAALTTADADVVVVTGSSSAGAADHLHGVLNGIGARRLVDQVACRPGRPQLLAELPGTRWVVGLPGNPFAGLVACVTVLGPLLHGLSGRAAPDLIRLPVTGDLRPAPGVTRLVPVRLAGDHALVVPGGRPASLRGAALADALAVLEDGWTTGIPADLIPLNGLNS
ncbi:molybdopterin molybdotransferase MoeA [Actinoplanes friuliensis]|uniref:Molybdopterin molybdenumtransferase n=1 Tax=Actinoplanes friuliensis DSM 7358 TaxID=1246995 RepID=U5W0Z7_9ACTN|nr:molybdopterin molybdotransferase MoeA [Actinoplanes friuliensis]AGZ42819.1 MoeA domain-containing protein domain I and II [Actinoplanes friuliensis DSM 7358]